MINGRQYSIKSGTAKSIADDAFRGKRVSDRGSPPSCGDSETARAEAAFRDGVVRAKLAELERYVKEQMTELRRENRAYLESLRQELLQSRPSSESSPEGGNTLDRN